MDIYIYDRRIDSQVSEVVFVDLQFKIGHLARVQPLRKKAGQLVPDGPRTMVVASRLKPAEGSLAVKILDLERTG